MERKEFFVFGRPYYIDENGEIINYHGRKINHHFRTKNKNDYPYAEFRKNTPNGIIRKKILVHRLVAKFFIPNPNNLPQVNHIDGNKGNCHVSNLEWVSAGENQIHNRYTLNNMTGFEDTSVECVETGIVYKSTRDAWRDTGAGYSHISECVKGKRKTAGGYHWRAVI